MPDDTCDDCFTDMLMSFATDDGEAISVLTSFIHELFQHAMLFDHAHPSHLIRINTLMLLLEDVSSFIRSRVELKMETEDKDLVIQKLKEFRDRFLQSKSIETIDDALETLPKLYADRVLHQTQRELEKKPYRAIKNPGSVN